MHILFWAAIAIIFYTYLGYPIILGLLVKIKSFISPRKVEYYNDPELPSITLIIACYNEAEILEKKIDNTFQLDYPIDRLNIYFVTDGSTDNSPEIIRNYKEITLFHENERKGKSAAVNRVMPQVKTPITVYCDANTFLNTEALKLIVRHYKNPHVGAVAGEKRVVQEGDAASSGEGAYWKYESKLKQWDSDLNTVVGAAGELFSIRTSLYEDVPKGVLIEDFRLSMNIARQGYKVVYEPEAYAIESGSESIEEERKRKVRITAGGLIEVWHFSGLLNFFRYGLLSFQYISHRMLRWTLAPLSLIIILFSNIWLVAFSSHQIFITILIGQAIFYSIAMVGYLIRNKHIKLKMLYIPYYFTFMNLSVFLGLKSLIKGSQTEIWDKAKRTK